MYNCVWYFSTYPYGLSLKVWYALLCIANNRHGVSITTHAIKRHFLILNDDGETTYETPTFLCFNLKIYLYLWTRQRIHNTLIVVDRYLRLMGDKTIPDSAEPRLESFCLVHPSVRDKHRVSEIDLSQPRHGTGFLVTSQWASDVTINRPN